MCSSVAGENFLSELHQVRDAASMRLPTNPQLQVLNTVIIPDTVSVMDSLPLAEWPAKMLLHNETVFEALLAPDDTIDVAIRTQPRLGALVE